MWRWKIYRHDRQNEQGNACREGGGGGGYLKKKVYGLNEMSSIQWGGGGDDNDEEEEEKEKDDAHDDNENDNEVVDVKRIEKTLIITSKCRKDYDYCCRYGCLRSWL